MLYPLNQWKSLLLTPLWGVSPGSSSHRFRKLVIGTALSLATSLATIPEAQSFELYKTFQTPEVFLAEVFDNQVPAPRVLMLNDAAQSKIARVFNRAFPQQRVRYWQDGDRSVWIFDDIGKEGYVPTTCGFVIRDAGIDMAKVLIYRESRGEQVGEPSFLNQLKGARAQGAALDKPVDNITGATLSVKMMQRMARTAIALDELARHTAG